MKDKKNKNYEHVNSPRHYNLYSVEAIDIVRKTFGDVRTASAAEIIAFLYRLRMGTKPENPIEQELKKEQWWLDKKKEIEGEILKTPSRPLMDEDLTKLKDKSERP